MKVQSHNNWCLLKSYCCLVFLFLQVTIGYAQDTKEIKLIAEQLLAKELVTPQGKEALEEYVGKELANNPAKISLNFFVVHFLETAFQAALLDELKKEDPKLFQLKVHSNQFLAFDIAKLLSSETEPRVLKLDAQTQEGKETNKYLPITIIKTYVPRKDWIHPNRSVLGKTSFRTLRDLYDIGLINHTIYYEVLRALQISDEYQTEMDVCTQILYHLHRKELMEESELTSAQVYEQLSSVGLLDSSQKEVLLASGLLEDSYHFGAYAYAFEGVKSYDVNGFEPSPTTGYNQLILDVISDVELCKDLQYVIGDIREYHNGNPKVWFGVSDKETGKEYGEYLMIFNRKNAANGLFFDHRFIKMFNRYLADKKQDVRLVLAEQIGPKGLEKLHIFPITPQQIYTWNHCYEYDENYLFLEENCTAKFFAKSMELHRAVGMVPEPSPDVIQQLRTNFGEYAKRTNAYPKFSLATYSKERTDSLCFSLLKELVVLAKGNVPFELGTNTFHTVASGEMFQLNFRLNDQYFEKTFVKRASQLDTANLSYVNEVLDQLYIGCVLLLEDHETLVYLNEHQYQFFMKHYGMRDLINHF